MADLPSSPLPSSQPQSLAREGPAVETETLPQPTLSTWWNAVGNFAIPQTIQKRLLRFLLKRSIGQFLEEELDLANLDVQLGNGLVQLRDLSLDTELLNGYLVDAPVALLYGRIGQVTVRIPWQNLWTADCSIEMDCLEIGIIPLADLPHADLSKPTWEDEATMEASMLMNSVYVANAFLQQEVLPEVLQNPSPENDPVSNASATGGDAGSEGLNILAAMIEKIVTRLRVQLRNTRVRLYRSMPKEGHGRSDMEPTDASEFWELALPLVQYEDETPGLDCDSGNGQWKAPSELIKSIKISGFTIGHQPVGGNEIKPLCKCPEYPPSSARLKIHHSAADPNGPVDVDVDTFVQKFAVLLTSSECPSLVESWAAISQSYCLMEMFREASGWGHAEPPKWPSSVSLHDRSHEIKAFQMKLHLLNVDVFLMENSQDRLGFYPSQFFTTLFHGDTSTPINIEDQQQSSWDTDFGKWINADHLKLSVGNISVRTGDIASPLQIDIQSLFLSEWITSATRKEIPQTQWTTPIDSYNFLLQFVPGESNGSPKFQPLFQRVLGAETSRGGISTPSIRIRREKVSEILFRTVVDLQPLHADIDVGTIDRLQEYLAQTIALFEVRAAEGYSDVHPDVFVRLPYLRLAVTCPDMSQLNYPDAIRIARHQSHLRKKMLVFDATDLQLCFSRGQSATVDFDSLHCSLQFLHDHRIVTILTAKPYAVSLDDPVQRPHISLISNGSAGLVSISTSTPTVASLLENLPGPAVPGLSPVYDFVRSIGRSASTSVEARLPSVAIQSNKMDFDAFQLLLNDLTLWEPWWIFEKRMQGRLCSTQRLAYAEETNSIEDLPEILPTTPGDVETRQQSIAPTLMAFNCSVTHATIDISDTDFRYHCLCEHGRVFLALRLFGVEFNNYVFAESETVKFVDGDDRCIFATTVPSYVSFVDPKLENRQKSIVLTGHYTYEPALNVKETDISSLLSNITWNYASKSTWLGDLASFIRDPNDIVYPDYNNRFTKLHVKLAEVSIEYRPLYRPWRSVLVVGSCDIQSTFIPGSETAGTKIDVQRANLLLVDSDMSLHPFDPNYGLYHNHRSSRKYWSVLGYVDVADVEQLHMELRTLPTPPMTDWEVSFRLLRVNTCADSFVTLVDAITYMFDGKDNHGVEDPADVQFAQPVSETASDYHDALLDLDEDAFGFQEIAAATSAIEADEGAVRLQKGYSELEIVEEHYGAGVSKPCIEIFSDSQEDGWEPVNLSSRSLTQSDAATGHMDSVRVLDSDFALHLVEEHFTAPSKQEPHLQQDFPPSDSRFRLKDSEIVWCFFGGYDWKSNQEKHADEFRRRKLRKMNLSSQNLHEMQTEVPPAAALPMEFQMEDAFSFSNDDDPRQEDRSTLLAPTDAASRQEIGTAARSAVSNRIGSQDGDVPTFERDTSNCMKATAKGFRIDQDTFEKGHQLASRFVWTMEDFEVFDEIQSSLWNKFLTHLKPDFDDPDMARQTNSKMFRWEVNNVRPRVNESQIEARVKIRILPIRLHVDQDALNFLVEFFSFEPPSSGEGNEWETRKDAKPLTYIQHCHVQSIRIKMDYKPKHVNFGKLNEGNYVELMNFFHLDGAEMSLRELRLMGITGYGKLLREIGQAWIPHITGTQLPAVLGGLSPIRSVVNIGSGVANLVLLPIEQYQKDGRIVRGLQRGAQRFVKTAAMEALKVGSRLATGVQVMLEGIDSMLTGTGSSRDTFGSVPMQATSKYAEQPSNFTEGLESAYESLSTNMDTAVRTIVAVPMEIYEGDSGGGIRTVVKAVPIAVLRPLIGTSEALRKTFLGLRNTIDAGQKKQMEDKYRQPKHK